MSDREGPVKGRTDGLDLYSQAAKVLSVRCPFEGEEAPKDPSLPSTLASFLERHLDGRKSSHKKAEEPSEKPPPPPPSDKTTIWDQTEEYFRPITLPDIENLLPKQLLDDGQLDSCFSVPSVGALARNVEKDTTIESEPVALSPETAVVPRESANIEQQIKNDAMDIADHAPTSAPSMLEAVQGEAALEDDGSSLHWLLGSKERFVLTSERPNKKHKLLGQEAGLERLLSLPQSGNEPCTSCDMCCTGQTGVQSNKLLCCDACKVLVHQKCYGVHDVPEEPWYCLKCRSRDSNSRQCVLCPKERGVLKPAGDGLDMFAHLFCSLWTPELYVADMKTMEPVLNVEGVPTMRKKLVCNVCKVKHGACVRCSHGTFLFLSVYNLDSWIMLIIACMIFYVDTTGCIFSHLLNCTTQCCLIPLGNR